MELTILYFIVMSLFGGLAFVLMDAESWAEVKSYKRVRHLIISIIVGVVYYLLYSEHSFPNLIMSFVSGYFGTDFITTIVEKYKKKKEENNS